MSSGIKRTRRRWGSQRGLEHREVEEARWVGVGDVCLSVGLWVHVYARVFVCGHVRTCPCVSLCVSVPSLKIHVDECVCVRAHA